MLIVLIKYRTIPNISPGFIEVRKYFLLRLCSGGAYFRRIFRFNRWLVYAKNISHSVSHERD